MGNMFVFKTFHHFITAILITGIPLQTIIAYSVRHHILMEELSTLRDNHIPNVELSFIEKNIPLNRNLIDKSINTIINPIRKFLNKDCVSSKEAAKLLVNLCTNLNATIQTNNTASDLYKKTIDFLRTEHGIRVDRKKLAKSEKWIKYYEGRLKNGLFGNIDILKCELGVPNVRTTRDDDFIEKESESEHQTYVKAFVSAFTGTALCVAAYCMRRTVVLGAFANYIDGIGMAFIGDAILQFRSFDTVEKPPRQKNMDFLQACVTEGLTRISTQGEQSTLLHTAT